MTGWLGHVTNQDSTIPRTLNSRLPTSKPRWFMSLNQVFPDMPSLSYSTKVDFFNACPSLQRKSAPIFYWTSRWGYAVNWCWSADGIAVNEDQSWDAIRAPSRYPWFLDPATFWNGFATEASLIVPDTSGNVGDWGIGWHHGSLDTANVAFADGSVRSVRRNDIREHTANFTDMRWFENR
jgi:prepilin-type processing-associated H-X9-DG protein